MIDDIMELQSNLARTPGELASLLEALPSANVTIKLAPDEFSVLENICHLRDIEIEGYTVRIQRILNEDRPFLPDLDGTRLAIERDYNRQSVSEALSLFSQARRHNLTVLSEVSESEFGREGELEGLGQITLHKLLEMMWEHDGGHLDELRRSVRLAHAAQSD